MWRIFATFAKSRNCALGFAEESIEMRSAEGLVVLKGFVLIFSVLIFSVLIFFRMDPVLPTRSEFMFLQNTQENDLCFNSAVKCGSSKRMPFEAADAPRNSAELW